MVLRDALQFPPESRAFLSQYLPPKASTDTQDSEFPHTTVTFATSLDSSLSLSPGTRTILSGPKSKALTHYLRSIHDAILIGVGTAIADNPSLNCRIEGVGGYGGSGLEGQPRPVIIDPNGRWRISEELQILKLVREGKGKAPWVVTSRKDIAEDKKRILEDAGGSFIFLDAKKPDGVINWKDILRALRVEGLRSVMIEGGGSVINSLLVSEYFDIIDSVIVTIAPTWLGTGGVVISPPRRFDENGDAMAALRLDNVQWHPFGEDVVMCGKIK